MIILMMKYANYSPLSVVVVDDIIDDKVCELFATVSYCC